MNTVIRNLKTLLRVIRAKGAIGGGMASWLRTVVPVLWGALITWGAAQLAWLPAPVVALLTSGDLVLFITGAVVAVWYAVWRRLEHRVPAWLTRLVLGSNQAPRYDGKPATR
ncbi:hypothetical protein CLV30_106147 [Haloactinopolyspora alba]|uniref:Uncharacterized protein n=1 Tax=Haloactinopolyspora alba TaxID=648780 RepID=A0A2P8E3U7_9ACTN|nr:hypothetical protein [Haloactinopolyspora alba]PSL04142.1 hypothetical protein CLV30_106147 [Haloactinopolyspora alba]